MTASGGLDRLGGAVSVNATAHDAALTAAALLHAASSASVKERRRFSVALTGGTTPRPLYELLGGDQWRGRFAWDAWEVFFSDERACPPDDEASNFHLVQRALLDAVPVEPTRVYRMEAERHDLDAAAADYSSLMDATLPKGPPGVPRLDCILLGLGENGHVASLFPDTPALSVHDRWATRGRADYAPFDRITLTFPAINAARTIVLLVTGEAKHEALQATAAGLTPAARVGPYDGELHWVVDSAAAGGDGP